MAAIAPRAGAGGNCKFLRRWRSVCFGILVVRRRYGKAMRIGRLFAPVEARPTFAVESRYGVGVVCET